MAQTNTHSEPPEGVLRGESIPVENDAEEIKKWRIIEQTRKERLNRLQEGC